MSRKTHITVPSVEGELGYPPDLIEKYKSEPCPEYKVDVISVTEVACFVSTPSHPSQADYVATNLLDALEQVPNTGDWHGEVRLWCEANKTGKLKPLRKEVL